MHHRIRAHLAPGLALFAAIATIAALAALPARAADAAASTGVAAAAPAASAAVAPPSLLSPPAAPASAPAVAAAAPASAPASPIALDGQVQALKADVIQLNRDLLVLEEELLFPASTQVAVFVSMDVGVMFDLDSVQIKLDDKVVSNYLYTPLEIAALHRGGVQRLYLGNLRAGQHAIVAFFTGKGPHDRDYKRGTTIEFEKGTDPKYLELQITDSGGKLQPEFTVKVWQ